MSSLEGTAETLIIKPARPGVKSHQQSVVEALWEQCESKSDLCDVTLVIGDTELKAHWCVLVMCPYFESVRNSGMSEATSGRVTLVDTTVEAMQAALHHIYLGTASCDDPKICSGPASARYLMQLADYLQLTELKDQCAVYLARTVASSFGQQPQHGPIGIGFSGSSSSSIEEAAAFAAAARMSSSTAAAAWSHHDQGAACSTALDLYRFAEMYDSPLLRTAAYRAIVRDFEAAATQPEMMSLDAEALGAFLSDRNLRYVPARVMYELLVRWVKHDHDSRAEYFSSFFRSLSLDGIDLDFYDQHIATNVAVQTDANCLRHARQHRHALRRCGGGSGGGSGGRHGLGGSSSGISAGRGSSAASAAASQACTASAGETTDVILVGGLRRSRLQYAYVIDEKRWTTLPTLPPADEASLPTCPGVGGLAINRLIAMTQADMSYLEAVVGQRAFAIRQDWQGDSAFTVYELNVDRRCWVNLGRVPLPGSTGPQASSSCVGYWMTAFACGSKLCFLYSLVRPGSRRNALMLAFVDVIGLAQDAAIAASAPPQQAGAGAGVATPSLASGLDQEQRRSSQATGRPGVASATAAAARDYVELYFNEGVDVRDFRYCVGSSKLYIIVYGMDPDHLQDDVCQLIIYDMERRRIVDQNKEAPFGDIMYLDRESRVCVQSFGKRFCKVYDSVGRQWKSSRKSVPAMPDVTPGREDFFTCVHKGCLYVLGGTQDCSVTDRRSIYSRTPLRYVLKTGVWEPLAEMPLEFCVDAEAFPISLPKSMLRCPVDCQHCEQIHREGVPTNDQRANSDRLVRRDANQRSRHFADLTSSDNSSMSEDYYGDDMSRDEDYEDDYDDAVPNDPDCLLM